MEIRPIVASLKKHRIPAVLIVLEIALACAVLCNAVFMVHQCIASVNSSNAIDEAGMSVITVGGIDASQAPAAIVRDLAAFHSIAGVKAAAAVDRVPLDHDVWLGSYSATPTEAGWINSSIYFLGDGGERAMGLRLLQGRYFTPEEYAGGAVGADGKSTSHVVIINESDAKRLWPGQNALGKQLYSDETVWTVIGVVADVLAQAPDFSGGTGKYSSVFFPLRPDVELGRYVLRSSPADRDRVLAQAMRALGTLEPGAVLEGHAYVDMRSAYFADVRGMAWMLTLVCAVMLAVTALGIVGLTSFWVGQRRRQIGIRRAVGATHAQILRYFQTENFLLSTAGVLLGVVLAVAANLYLVRHYEVGHLPWSYLASSVLALWVLGQVAVLGPALRAAAVPPVVATRSV
ncbi:hypothetical protein DWU98_07815 [Dyella monticola]|uniref:ABC transporter permease n=1 Tax=Dyella monticola TaxID=1927958 RepID=A0A370X3R5_9GAMM|nr:FtsX-like permease family protein [Dyella monticola]RDS83028.1 hypothetical protein DWU98_07815 [Dyella monticola]